MTAIKKIDLLDVLVVFSKRKSTFLNVLGIITILGFAIAFIWPKSYKAEISFIVTEGNAINFSSGGLLSGLANLSVNGANITSDQAIVLIRSRAIQNKVISEFDLANVYSTDIPEALRKKLDDRIEIEEIREAGLGFNNIISITMSYVDEDPKRAFDVLNYYFNEVELEVEELNRKNVEDGFLLLQSRLDQNEVELRIAEDSLVSFQTKFGILEIEEQAKAQISGIGGLKAEIVKLEVEIGYLTQVLGENSSKIADLKLQKNEYEKKYDEMLNGVSIENSEFDIFQPISEMPELFLEYLRRYRDVIIQEEIYKVLYPQYEQQKLNYEEVSSGLRIVDPTLLPTYKDGPKRAYIIIATFLFGLFFSIIIVFYKEWREHLLERNPSQYNRYKEFLDSLKVW